MALYLGIMALLSLGGIIGSGAVLYADNSIQQTITDSNYKNITFDAKCDSNKIINSMQSIEGSVQFSKYINGFIMVISVILFILSIIGIIYVYNKSAQNIQDNLKASIQKSSNILTSKFLYFVILIILFIAILLNVVLYSVALVSIKNIDPDCFPKGPQRDAVIAANGTLTYQVISNVIIAIILLIAILSFAFFANLNQSLLNLKSNIGAVKEDIRSQAQQLIPVSKQKDIELKDK